jgi:hypothetical protein
VRLFVFVRVEERSEPESARGAGRGTGWEADHSEGGAWWAQGRQTD